MPRSVYPYYCYCYQYFFKFIPLSRLRLLQIFAFLIKIIKSALQMDILYNNTLINSIVDKLFKHRRVHYSEYHLDDLLQGLNIKHEISEVINANYEQIYTSLFTKGQAKPQYCIVYMHGYGSNRLECVNVLRYLPKDYALCSFDFSGCGKSQGDLVTYGMKEKEDIHFILNFLKGRGFKRFILWGRSMGATSALLYSIKYKPSNIILLVLDSPFHSFQSIAFEIANKNMNLPEFLISFGLRMAKKNCIQFQHNPFKIQLNNIHEITIPSVFVYCQQDSVINSHNTYLLCSKYKAKFEKLVINQDHNTIRSEVTVNKILHLIEKYDKRDRINLPLSYNQASNSRPFVFQYQNTPIREKILKKANETRIQFYSKKGIQRVSQLIKTEKKKIVYEISDQIMKDSTLQNDFFSSPAPKRANLSLNNLQSSQQFIRKNSTIKTQKRPLKHKNKIGLSGGLYQTSAQNNSQKNMNKKINVVQSSKYNSCKISTIIK